MFDYSIECRVSGRWLVTNEYQKAKGGKLRWWNSNCKYELPLAICVASIWLSASDFQRGRLTAMIEEIIESRRDCSTKDVSTENFYLHIPQKSSGRCAKGHAEL